MMASGVSSTIISTPVAASNARMFRPSRPITSALYVIIFDVKNGDGVFNGLFGSNSLNCFYHNLLGIATGIDLSFIYNVLNLYP